MDHVIASGDGLNEYEDALNLVLSRTHVAAVDVTGLPWTEIDFAEDLRRAESEILPRVLRVDADG
jgi:choline kinase